VSWGLVWGNTLGCRGGARLPARIILRAPLIIRHSCESGSDENEFLDVPLNMMRYQLNGFANPSLTHLRI